MSVGVRGAGILAIAIALLALPAQATGQELGAESTAEAEGTLAQAEELMTAEAPQTKAAGEPSRELSLVLADLSASLPRLDRGERRRARALLARPTDPNDQFGDSYPPAALATADFDCTPNFCVHWVETGQHAPDLTDTSPANGVPDYVEDVQDEAEFSRQIENDDLGWVEPVPDGTLGGDDKTDVYLFNVSGLGFFGYTATDPGQGSGDEKHAYLVLDESYDDFDPLTPLDAMKVTMAHEYNHVLQFAYDLRVQGWMFESTATWMEDLVYPDIDDYLNYVPAFANNPQVPLTKNNNRRGSKIYGAAVWNHFISEGAPNAVRDAWDVAPDVSPAHFAVGAYDSVLGGSGSKPFAEIASTFVNFAADSAEWRANSSAYEDHEDLPNVKRSGKLRVGGPAVKFRLDHLAYRLLKVPTPAPGTHLKLRVRAPDNTRTGIDLVARTGPATTGSVEHDPVVDPDGGNVRKILPGELTPFDRITAAVVNADARVKPNGSYRRDGQLYRAKVVVAVP